MEGIHSIYINNAPDLAVPGAKESIADFVEMAKKKDVKKLVLLSGRGEEEAQACEEVVQESGIPNTIVRAGWFNQNFSEGAFVSMVLTRQITLPGSDRVEPWVDVDDIADVIVASLTESGHDGELYEVTGPRLMSFVDLASDLSKATGQDIQYIDIPHKSFIDELKKQEVPKDVLWLLDYLFSTVLDGRNAYVCDGVERALGRPPKDFSDYAKDAYRLGTWDFN
jgi:uncharacterized protein YbjT (DUF2867 family)